MLRVCHAASSGHCSLVFTCWESAGLLALLYVMFSCVFATFPRGVLGQVWYLILSIPGLCLLIFHIYQKLTDLNVSYKTEFLNEYNINV